MLTGEVLPAAKTSDVLPGSTATTERTNLAFSGTLVTSGRGLGVVATGAESELGEINTLIQSADTRSPLDILTHNLERRIGIIVAVGAAFVFVRRDPGTRRRAGWY